MATPRKGASRVIYSSLSDFEGFQVCDAYSVKLVLSGEERYVVDGRPMAVKAGHFLVVNPGQTVECTIRPSVTADGMCFYVDPKIMRGMLQPFADEEPQDLRLFDDIFDLGSGSLGGFLTRFAATFDDSARSMAAMDAAFYYALGERLLASQGPHLERMQSIDAGRASTRKELYRRLRRALQLIEEGYDQPLQVADLAREAAMSEFHFIRSFRSAIGSSPHQYLMAKRMNVAQSLLRSGRFSVSEVATHTGFCDIHAFSKAFKRECGLSPSIWARDQERFVA